jgi:hypothetical protein
MLWGKRKPGPSATRRQVRAFRPTGNTLETRVLLAIDLANIAGNTAGTPPGPYGVLEAGGQNGGGVGWSVANVGDVNGDGFQDFVLGAPSVNNTGSVPVLGPGNNARAYLIFGSAKADGTNSNWLTLTANDRVGDLNNLGSPNQNNPLNGSANFPFNGITFITGQNPNSALGASVVGLGNIDGNSAGISSFLIGAPGANNNNGAAYLVYGSPALTSLVTKTVDLDNLGGSPGVAVLTFGNSSAGARTGRSVAFAGPFLDDGFNDIAIGAPNATISGSSGQGAVYVVPGNFLTPARIATVDLSTTGQAGGIGGLIFSGANSADAAGRSAAGVGNVNGATNGNGRIISDLAIGAPQVGDTGVAAGPGKAYLIYGGANLFNLATTVQGVSQINLSRVGSDVPGAVFLGDATGDQTGFSVATGGDFNGDGLGDFLIGSPGWNGGQGRATLIEGVAAGSGQISGTLTLSALPSTVPFVEFDGQTPDAAAGFSVGSTGPIITGVAEQLLIGTPGFNGGEGAAWLIPANAGLFGVQTLSESSPVFATEMTLSTPAGKNFLGSSVGGNLFVSATGQTADTDGRSDFVIGSTGFPLTTTAPRTGAGGGFMLQGAFIPVQTPVIQTLTSQIGVDAPFGAPFRISATTPSTLLIYVFSSTTSGNPNFVPLRDLDPTTVKVNGVAFPGATIAADPVDENGDGLQDAIITITPRSAIGLTTATTTFTLTARTLSSSPNANQSYSSSTSIIVSGGGSGGGGIPSSRNAALGLGNENAAVPQFGSRFLPTPITLSKLSTYKPLPSRVAFNQFLPVHSFAWRNEQFLHPRVVHPAGSRFQHAPRGISTLSRSVFKRGRFPTGLFTGPIFHKVKNMIPPSLHR